MCSPRHPWCSWWLYSYAVPWFPRDWGPCTMTGQQILGSQPQWGVFHPLLQHSPANSYLALFRSNASSIRSSQGTVNSSKTTCLDDYENRNISGLSVVVAMVSGNLSRLPRSTFSCQSRAIARSPPAEFLLPCGFSPALTNVFTSCWLLVLAERDSGADGSSNYS